MITGIEKLLFEFLLIAGILASVLVSAMGNCTLKNIFPRLILLPIMGAGIVYLALSFGGGMVFDKQLMTIDAVSQYGKLLIAVLLGLVILVTSHFISKKDYEIYEHRFDIFSVLLLSALGMCVMVSANDLITFYMGLELQSLALYVLIAFKRHDAKASEAALKYLILGALGSGLFLFGSSMIYGAVGSVSYPDLYVHENFIGGNLYFIVGAALVLTALFFKLSAAPFHMWTPDVYQGSPSFVTAFVATAPKVAAVIGVIRLSEYAFAPIAGQIHNMFIVAAVLSLFTGAIMAVRQSSLYRMLAYSTITHMGYVLLALSVSSHEAMPIVMEYLTIYLITSFAAFTLIGSIYLGDKSVDNIASLSGFAKNHPKYAFLLMVMMLSTAGIPPMAGFFIKFNILSHVIHNGIIIPAVLAVLASAISAFYYLRVIKVMYFDAPNNDVIVDKKLCLPIMICTIPVLVYIFVPSAIKSLVALFIRAYGYE